MLAGTGLAQLNCYFGTRAIRLGLALLLVAVTLTFAQLTRNQVEVWENDVTLWEQAVRVSPASIPLRTNLAFSYNLTGDYQAEASILQTLIRDKPDHEPYYEGLIDAYKRLGQPVELAAVYTRMGRPDKAAAVYRSIIESDARVGLPGYVMFILYGEALCHAGKFKEAKGAALEALLISPDHEGAKKLLRDIENEDCS